MSKYNWKEAEYPCFGMSKKVLVCFSESGKGHVVKRYNDSYEDGEFSDDWAMEAFKPYTPPKEKTKLWYWEYSNDKNMWFLSDPRLSEEEAKEVFEHNQDYRKIEALGYIEE